MKKINLTLVVVTFIIVLGNSIVYGALNTNMFINGEAYVRVDKDIRITDLKILEQTNGAYETYNRNYSKDTTSLQITLPNSNSTITYAVTVTNKSNADYEVTGIVEESYSNSDIKYELIDMEKGTVISKNSTYVFKIKLTTITNN